MRVSGSLWRRYRWLAVVGVLLGAFVGVIFVFVIGGDNRMLPSKAGLGGSLGAITGLIACTGGYFALRRRALAVSTERLPSGLSGAGGAGIAVLAMWMILGMIAALWAGEVLFLMLTLPIAIIGSLITWTVAAFALEWDKHRHM